MGKKRRSAWAKKPKPQQAPLADTESRAKRLAALPYSSYLNTLHWRELRSEALKRFGGYCENCGVREATEVHHKTYERLGRENPSDLTPLCRQCHLAKHKTIAKQREEKRRASLNKSRFVRL